jgi:hypothetical protein
MKLSCTTADTSIAASEYLLLSHYLEGQDLQQIKKGTASAEQLTLSFWVKGNATATYVAELYDVDNNRQISKTFAVTTSWAKITLLIPADTTGAFGDDNAASLGLGIWLHAGSSYTSGTLNSSAWAANNNTNRAAGISSFFDATSRTFFMTGVQMELGATATEFEHRTYGEDLALCQRYYTRFTGVTNLSQYGVAEVASATKVRWPMWCPVEMRAVPTMTFAGTSFVIAWDRIGSAVTSLVLGVATTKIQSLTGTISSGTVGQAVTISAASYTDTHISFDSEL